MPKQVLPENVYPGMIDIGGPVDAELVQVYMPGDGFGITLRGGTPASPCSTRKEMHVTPVTGTMLRAHDPKVMMEGIYYQMEGTSLGGCSRGPLGNPGDGEYDVYVIRRFEMLATYTAAQLTVKMAGATDAGSSGWLQGSGEALPAISFRAEFTVAHARLAAFFGLRPELFKHLDQLMQACG